MSNIRINRLCPVTINFNDLGIHITPIKDDLTDYKLTKCCLTACYDTYSKILPINKFSIQELIDNPIEKCVFTNCKCPNKAIKNVEIALDTTCNLRCEHCFVKKFGYNQLPNKERKQKYFDMLYKLKGNHLNSIRLTDWGEPMFYKKETIEYIDSLSLDDLKQLKLVTNLTLLDSDWINCFKRLLDKEIKLVITISIDGISKKTYESIRHFSFEKLLENIEKLLKLNYKNLVILGSYTRQPLNELEPMEDINRFFKSYNMNYSYNTIDEKNLIHK